MCHSHYPIAHRSEASPQPKSRAFPVFDLQSLGVKARLLQAAVSITTPHSLTATSTSSLISSLSFNPSTNHSPSVTPYLSRRLLNTIPLAHDMKLKKLAVALATTPFGIAAALTAPGSAPPYGNVSVNDTAAIDPYVYMFLLSSVVCLAQTLSSFPRSGTSNIEGAIYPKCRTPLRDPTRCRRLHALHDAVHSYATFSKVSSVRCHQITTRCHTLQPATLGNPFLKDLLSHLLSQLPPAGLALPRKTKHLIASKHHSAALPNQGRS